MFNFMKSFIVHSAKDKKSKGYDSIDMCLPKKIISHILTPLRHISTYKFERQNFRTGRRIAPKFGTHVPIYTLTLIGYKKLTHPTPGGFRGLLDVVRSFLRVTAVLAAKQAARQCWLPCWPRIWQNGTTARPRTTDRARPRTTTNDRPRMTDHARTTTHDHARPTAHVHELQRTTTHDRPRTTAHDRPRMTAHHHARTTAHHHARPRTTDHGCHICLRKRYPPHPRGV